MRTPTIVSLGVVNHEGKKMLLAPKGIVRDPFANGHIQVVGGTLMPCASVMYFASYDDRGREVDTPCLLFRNGEYHDHGHLFYRGGQDSGYLTWGGFSRIKTDNPKDSLMLHASWFDVGDVISFVMMTNPR